MSVEYGFTEQYVTHDMPYEQSFFAQESRLETIEFTIGYEEVEENGNLLFELLDEEEQVLVSDKISFADIEDGMFCKVTIDKWVRKGHEYKYRLCVKEEYDNIFYGIYTLAQEHHAPGSLSLCVGGEPIDGQGVARYSYGYPLNVNNVLCLWGFIIVVCLSICGVMESFGQEDKRIERSAKLKVMWNRLWELLERYQLWILLAELAVILGMTAYICRTRTVDWDEAYSIQMITKYSFAEMFQITAGDIHPPLYYVLLWAFSKIFGTSVFALKLMSVIINCCVMLLGITKVRKNWGWHTALLFNLVVGLGPQFIFYSVNIRMYSLSLFFVMCCALLGYDVIKGAGKKEWILFVLSALGGAYTHYFTVVPLAFVCGYLLVGLLLKRRQECKYFLGICAGIILGYLPWLFVVISSFQREGFSDGMDVNTLDFKSLIEWAFSTNIKFSNIMPVILFTVAILLMILEWKKYDVHDKLFLSMCALNLPFSYVVCRLIASMNQHFWDNRYVFAALGCFWLFLFIIYSRRGTEAFCALAIWLSVMVLSAFVIHKATELGTNAYMDATYQVLEQVRGEKTILYNYDTYDVLYASHLREQEFVFIDDVDWENLKQDYLYIISWGGHWFDEEVAQKYIGEVIDCGTMRFEEGVAGVKLFKIVLNPAKG